MYKCSECGAEYDTKPDYCDCGNDTFEEVKPEPTPVKEPAPQKIEKQVELETKKEPLQVNNIQGFQPQPPKTKIKKDVNPISIVIFILCLILSAVVILFVGNPKEEIPAENSKKEETIPKNINIPSLNSFWNNSTVGVVSDNVQNEAPKPQPVKEEQKSQEQPKVIVQPQIIYVHDAPAAPKTNPTTQTKKTTTTPTKTTTTTSKPATTTKTTTTTKTQTQPTTQKTTTQNTRNKQQNTYNHFEGLISKGQSGTTGSTTTTNTPKQQTTTQTNTNKTTTTTTTTPSSTTTSSTTKPTTSAPQPSTTTTTTTTNQTQQTVTLPKIDPGAAKVELANYKISLRNTIGRKIDFAKVVGDGDCAITFKINSSGKLTNRAFAKQSSNITLNDAVYAAMMATPSFNAPPSAYNNETLRLTVKFYNGNFEINLN